MLISLMLLAYLGPETMLPMTSMVAGAVGVAMLFGRNALRFAMVMARKCFAKVGIKPKPRAKVRKIGRGPVGPISSPAREKTEV